MVGPHPGALPRERGKELGWMDVFSEYGSGCGTDVSDPSASLGMTKKKARDDNERTWDDSEGLGMTLRGLGVTVKGARDDSERGSR